MEGNIGEKIGGKWRGWYKKHFYIELLKNIKNAIFKKSFKIVFLKYFWGVPEHATSKFDIGASIQTKKK